MNTNPYPEKVEIVERCMTSFGELQLQRRGAHYELISNGTFLMASYNGSSERLLVRAALKACPSPKRVLIGGLGFGYSLQEAVNDARVEEAVVVEISKEIVEWNRSHLAELSGRALEHAKTRLVQADLLQWIEETAERFDAICLDIDNGPDWCVYEDNRSLYSEEGLVRLAGLLTPHGAVSFWSANPSPRFERRLRHHFTRVEALTVGQEQVEPDAVYVASEPRT